jgi:uncharacterized membrane protein YagU involved in acid resistance
MLNLTIAHNVSWLLNFVYLLVEAWTGQRVVECSLYGVRVYKENAILATHVDRLPLVSSAIINVDQDVDEPWPLEVIGHDGKAVNITMEPGKVSRNLKFDLLNFGITFISLCSR